MLERLWFYRVSRAGELWFYIKPEGVGRKVALGGTHLMHPPCHKLPWAQEGVRRKARGVVVIGGGGGGVGVPSFEHLAPAPNAQAPNPMPFVLFFVFYFMCFVLSTTENKDRVEH